MSWVVPLPRMPLTIRMTCLYKGFRTKPSFVATGTGDNPTYIWKRKIFKGLRKSPQTKAPLHHLSLKHLTNFQRIRNIKKQSSTPKIRACSWQNPKRIKLASAYNPPPSCDPSFKDRERCPMFCGINLPIWPGILSPLTWDTFTDKFSTRIGSLQKNPRFNLHFWGVNYRLRTHIPRA